MQNVAKHVIQNTLFWTKQNNKMNEYSTMISSSSSGGRSRNNNDDDDDDNNNTNPDLD